MNEVIVWMKLNKKIMCTLGPSSLNSRVIKRLSELNVDLFRLNLSHTPLDKLEEYVKLIRKISNVPICFDSQGAQIRTGNLIGGKIELKHGSVVSLVPSFQVLKMDDLPLYPDICLSKLEVGDLISLDFDTALIQVIEKNPNIKARIICSGLVGSNKAVSMIDHIVPLPSMTDVDIKAFNIAKKLGIKCIALSFVNKSSDVKMLRKIMGKDIFCETKNIYLINKILHVHIQSSNLKKDLKYNKMRILKKINNFNLGLEEIVFH